MKQLKVLAIVELVLLIVIIMLPTKSTTEVTEESKYQYSNSKNIYIASNYQEETIEEIKKNEDIELLARLIYGEAGADYCSDEMRYLVGAVALNRVKSKYFPDTLAEVIDQAGQYDCLNYRYFYQEPSESCYRIAYELITYGYDVPNTVVFQSEFIQGKGVYKQVQNMYFCYR